MKSTRNDLTGHYAGAASRFLAHSADLAIAGVLYITGSAAFDYVLRTVAGVDTLSDSLNAGRAAAMAVWLFVYWWASIAISGKTPGKAILGLRVLSRAGSTLSSGRAALRSLALPVSYLLFGAGFLGIVVGRERRALHDLIATSVVVYDWGERNAEMPTPISNFLAKRQETDLAGGSGAPVAVTATEQADIHATPALTDHVAGT